MTTALTVYERMTDPVTAIKVLGNSIAKSGMFGCGSVEAGEVFAMECLARRMPPLMLAERYHVIFGKLSMKAEAMLAGFEAEGGKYRVLARTPEMVAIEMEISGQKHSLSLTWDEAQKEAFVYEGKENAVCEMLAAGKTPPLKPKYSTPRSRMQMLWARLVSDSVRFLCPKVVVGVYTPEEIEDGDGEVVASNGSGNGHKTTTSVVDQAAAAVATAASKAPQAQQPVVEAEFVVKSDTPQVPLATEEQVKRIGELEVLLQCGEKINAALAKRKLGSTRSLTRDDAAAILANLEAHAAAQDEAKKEIAAKAAAREAATKEPPQEQPPCGPATDSQLEGIRKANQEFAQIDQKGYREFMDSLKLWMSQNGKAGLKDLDANQAAKIYDAMRVRSLPTFIRYSLANYKPKN